MRAGGILTLAPPIVLSPDLEPRWTWSGHETKEPMSGHETISSHSRAYLIYISHVTRSHALITADLKTRNFIHPFAVHVLYVLLLIVSNVYISERGIKVIKEFWTVPLVHADGYTEPEGR